MSLRNILYADTTALDNYMSSIEGYTYDEAVLTNTSTNEKGAKANLGAQNFSIGGNLETQKGNSSTINVKITDASKLDKIIKYLEKENELKYYEFIDDTSYNDIHRNDFLEVLVTPRFSKVEEISALATNLKQMVENFQPLVEEPILDNKATTAISGIESLSKFKKSNSITCVFNFEDKKYPIVAYLDENHLNVSKDKFISQTYMLCKVQKKIEKGDSILLDEIFGDIKSLVTNREQRRKLPKNLYNPSGIKDKINGPAFQVIPIAIYQ